MNQKLVGLACSLLLSSAANATMPAPVSDAPTFNPATTVLTIPALGVTGGNNIVKDVVVRLLNVEVVSIGASVVAPEWMAGTWVGQGSQNGSTNWSIEANSTNGAVTIAYPSLNCSGRWDLMSADSSHAMFTEVITVGTSTCGVTGRVVITKIDSKHVTFSYWRSSGELSAWSTLTKKP
jgi:hypothetical protein